MIILAVLCKLQQFSKINKKYETVLMGSKMAK
jgi:hypothetical protein